MYIGSSFTIFPPVPETGCPMGHTGLTVDRLKRLFKEEWEVPYNVNISEAAPYTSTVAGELALTAHVSKHAVDYKWHGEWATSKELHDSQGVKDLLQKSEDLIMRTSKGSKGTMKGTSKGAHRP